MLERAAPGWVALALDGNKDLAGFGGSREARGVADRGVTEGVGDELLDGGVVGQAERPELGSLANVAEELVDRADRRAGGRDLLFGARSDAERDPDERELPVAGPDVEAQDLRDDGRQGRSVGNLPAAPDRMP